MKAHSYYHHTMFLKPPTLSFDSTLQRTTFDVAITIDIGSCWTCMLHEVYE